MIWEYVFFAVLALYVYTNIPTPQSVRPAGLGDFDIPTSDSTRDIQVIFGSPEIKSADVVWYGDLKTVAIRKKGGKK